MDGVSFVVEPGQVVGLLGPNGAGKTTTLKCALGLIEPTEGRVTICGFDVRKQRRDALRRVGAVLEGSRNVFWRLSPLENLLYFANLMGVPTSVARKQAVSLLERFGLAERLHQQVGELSRGMQQKVAVCAALIRNPQLLLLDEPTLGLDVETAIQLKETLATLAREEGRALVVTSHQMELAEELCDRVIIMQKGRVVADEQVERLLAMFATRAYRFHTERPLSDTCASRIQQRFPAARIETDPHGSRVEVTFASGEQLYQVVALFQEDGCILQSVEHLTPDLAEVFLRLTREGAPA